MILKNNPTVSFIAEFANTVHRYRGAILFWIYLMAIVAYATRLVEY